MPKEGSDRKIFVGGLSYNTDNNGLREYFEKFGELDDYIVMRFPETQRSRGFGFVTFMRKESVDHAMSIANHAIDGRPVELKRATPKFGDGPPGVGGGRGRDDEHEEEINPESKIMRKIFIGGLHYDTTEETMREYFSRWGNLEDCVVMKFPDSGRSRGFGFITYEKAFSVDDCQNARPHKIDNKTLDTKRATPRSGAKNPESQVSVKKIFVGNLSEDMSDDDIRDYFSKFGQVDRVEQLKWNDTGKKRGFGFVEFEDTDTVDKICLINRHYLLGKRLETRKALSKQEMTMIKKAQMKEEWNSGNSSGRGGFDSNGSGGMNSGGMGGGNMGGGNMGGGNMGGGGNMMGGGNMGGGNMGGSGGGNMNPMQMMSMMMNMMNNMNNMNQMNQMSSMQQMMSMMGSGGQQGSGSGGSGGDVKPYGGGGGSRSEDKSGGGGYGSSSGQSQSANGGGYGDGGYGSYGTGYGNSSVYSTGGGYGGGYGSGSGGASGGASNGQSGMEMMANMMNMWGAGAGNGGGGGGWGNSGSASGGPIRNSGNGSARDSSAPYNRR